VGAGREELADEADDAGANARERLRDLEAVDPAVEPGRDVVLPVDPVEVDGIDVPQADRGQPRGDRLRDQRRIAQLGEGRDADAALLAALRGLRDRLLVEAGDDP
jgi:hypothetical protein